MIQAAAEVAGVCLVATVLCRIMDKYQKEYAVMLAAVASAGVFIAAVSLISPVIDSAKELLDGAGVGGAYQGLLFKALGICYIIQFACEICRDNGEGALASQLEFAGKVILTLLALPLFNDVLSVISGIMAV